MFVAACSITFAYSYSVLLNILHARAMLGKHSCLIMQKHTIIMPPCKAQRDGTPVHPLLMIYSGRLVSVNQNRELSEQLLLLYGFCVYNIYIHDYAWSEPHNMYYLDCMIDAIQIYLSDHFQFLLANTIESYNVMCIYMPDVLYLSLSCTMS